jgi:hypothetical protein
MSDQVTNKTVDENQLRVVEMVLPPSTSASDILLRRIAILLFILVAGLVSVFGYYASSICITVVLAGFLAILFEPVVVTLEKSAISNRLRSEKDRFLHAVSDSAQQCRSD